ncbi:MAG: cardiolipin synthase [Oscillospiraceae bacterium]
MTKKSLLQKIKGMLFSRVVIVALLIAFQLGLLLVFVLRLSRYFAAMYGVLLLLSLMALLHVINKEDNPSYKLAWVVPILSFPLFGGLFYLLFGQTRLGRRLYGWMQVIQKKWEPLLQQAASVEAQIGALDREMLCQSQYILKAGFPAFANTATTYHPSGESKFAAMCEALEKAERYIFLEYFIVEEGTMWNTLLEILERKVQQGVEVRMMYDGFGCMFTLPDHYFRQMREKGIQCIEFNPLVPLLSILMNNRDHRKILVIDGHTGFMGGVNLADEYINLVDKHGHWKDCAVELHGDAVWSLVLMFLTMWEGISGEAQEPERYHALPGEIIPCENGFVQPYSDSPLDDELIGEMVYLNIINRARDYLYICTPYLIIDNETVTALLLAAKSGVDVRIITPGHGDKWFVHVTTRAYYSQLIRGGVKIYEYTPGFIHSKSFVCDDEVATVGTINLDYRSLYLHFECGVWMVGTSAVAPMKADFFATLEQCEQMTLENPIVKVGPAQKLLRAVLRLLAPLM